MVLFCNVFATQNACAARACCVLLSQKLNGMKASKIIFLALLLLLFVPASAKRTKSQNTHEYVDLGLSVNWATCNVGASKPEEDGNYFAWGETETKTSDYLFDDYKWYVSETSGLDKDNNVFVFSFNRYNNEDGKTNLDSEDDVAYVKWGGNWRMPTKEECQELIDSCTCTWETVNGVNGIRFTSKKKGYEDRSVFMPATGYHNMYSTESNHMTHRGNVVQLYSSTKDSNHDDYAFVINCGRWSEYQTTIIPEVSFVSRCSAQFVRPVCPK